MSELNTFPLNGIAKENTHTFTLRVSRDTIITGYILLTVSTCTCNVLLTDKKTRV